MSHSLFKQPKAFYTIFMLEIWERFGYSSLLALLVIYLTTDLHMLSKDAFVLFGSFSALVYAFIVFGGYLGDRVLGAKRTIVLGLMVLLCGYSIMALNHPSLIYYGLACVCVGTGLFKSNPSSLLARCYDQSNSDMLHNAFTLFYMAINVGTMFGMFFIPILANKLGVATAFIAAIIGIILSLITFLGFGFSLKGIGTKADFKPLSLKSLFLSILAIIIFVQIVSLLLNNVIIAKTIVMATFIICAIIYVTLMFKIRSEGFFQKMLLALILMAEAIVYKISYMQMQTSINFYTINNATHQLFGLDIAAASFQSLNPIWIVIMSPLLAYYYMNSKGTKFALSIYSKFAIGMMLLSFAFLILYVSKYFASPAGIISGYWLVVSYLFQSVGELLISALGLAMVAQLVPQRFSGFVIGVWWVFLAFGSILGGLVAAYTSPSDKLVTDKLILMHDYTQVFLAIGVSIFLFSLFMFSLSKFKAKLLNH